MEFGDHQFLKLSLFLRFHFLESMYFKLYNNNNGDDDDNDDDDDDDAGSDDDDDDDDDDDATTVAADDDDGCSCQSSLFKLCEEMRHAMDHNEIAAMILIDHSKSFGCLPHNLMVGKLTAYSMSPSGILKEVPQGSVLGPCLLIYF